MQEPVSISQINDVFDIVKSIDEIIKERRPFNMNIIDELHANENAHTRILIKLLQYSSGKDYPVLRSFLSMANDILQDGYTGNLIQVNIKKPEISYDVRDGRLK